MAKADLQQLCQTVLKPGNRVSRKHRDEDGKLRGQRGLVPGYFGDDLRGLLLSSGAPASSPNGFDCERPACSQGICAASLHFSTPNNLITGPQIDPLESFSAERKLCA
ncbi:uncharacterized protein LOC102382623 isoform X13 [Alligator sinensis]|uniref:Uncharacterized protein LOC102382623 isoform X13 n=1 Tax=Alligator sinensis TaxID=38654 RepID=A0A3Q0GBI6_ALLSI|nr:uncharacterized protein LOC102382623 isoform X13 [Alligator sinensis]